MQINSGGEPGFYRQKGWESFTGLERAFVIKKLHGIRRRDFWIPRIGYAKTL